MYVSRKQKRDIKTVSKLTVENNPNKYFHQMQTGHCPDWGWGGAQVWPGDIRQSELQAESTPRGGRFVLSGISRFQ